MNRNNFFIHLALALVLILVAAFAGQLSRWRKQWKSHMRIVPATEKKATPPPSTISRSAKLAASAVPKCWSNSKAASVRKLSTR